MPKPKPVAEDYHAEELHDALVGHGFKHLRVRRRGDTLTLESGPKGTKAFAHARIRRETVHLWRLEMPTSSGRWETTPVREVTDTLVTMLVTLFPWALAPRT